MLNDIRTFLSVLPRQRQLIFTMARREVEMHYAGSVLGVAWTFIHPIVLIFVFWFVFSVGFKSKPMNNVPFASWLTAGMMPWFFFSDILMSSVGVVVANVNLIKKTLFPSEVLPLVRIVASLVTHIIFLALLLVLLVGQHVSLSLYALQFFYYAFCLCFFALGMSWIVSALHVFVRDVGHVVNVIIQIGFWITPIFWDIHIMPVKIQFFLKLNPMFYIVQGYRDSFIYRVGFWMHPYQTLYFWLISLGTFLAGIYIFQRLKPQFADVL